jgi:hypothetical protein
MNYPAINTLISSPNTKSAIYTFQQSDISFDVEGNTLLKFPYSKNTYWTHFSFKPITEYDNLECEIILKTSDGYTYEVIESDTRKCNTWYKTKWTIPSVNCTAGIFLKIRRPPEFNAFYINSFIFTLYGLTDLHPIMNNYILMSDDNIHQIIFHKFDDGNNGSIYNIEHYDYIRDFIKDSCLIYPF